MRPFVNSANPTCRRPPPVYLKTTTTAGCPVRVHRLPPVPPSGGVRATVTASEPTAAAAAVSREVCRRRWRGRPRNRVGNGNSSNRLRAAIVSDHSRRRRRRRSFIVSASAVLPVSNGPSPHHCSRARPRVLFARRRRSVSTRRTHARSRRVSPDGRLSGSRRKFEVPVFGYCVICRFELFAK